MRRLATLLTAAGLGIFCLSAAPAPAIAETPLQDVFRDTIDDLFGGGKGKETESDAVKIPESAAEIKLSFAPLVAKAAPSVVNVYAARRIRQRSPFAGDPFFDRFFGQGGFGNPFGAPRKRVQSSLGSGVIISGDGIILTNHHVIKGADEVKIALNDGSEYACEIILTDEKSDLAVLKVKGSGDFPAIEIADSEEVQVGDLVLAIGNPFGVGQTVTSGIVSAVARSRVGINEFDFFIQTDAAINPGNSGGALIDMKGRLVGINTAIFSRSGGSNGIGFAIPANMAKVVIRSAISGAGRVARPWIGADLQEVTAEIAESLGMRRPGGVLVASVYPEGPAFRAGLRPGDVVVGINKKLLENGDALAYRLDTLGIGAEAELLVVSDNRRKTVRLTLEGPPETRPREETLLQRETILGGARIANLSPAVAQEVGISAAAEGVVVLTVEKPSNAAQNGIRKGDILLAINGHEIRAVADVIRLTDGPPRGGWQFAVKRQGRQFVFERNGAFFRQYIR